MFSSVVFYNRLFGRPSLTAHCANNSTSSKLFRNELRGYNEAEAQVVVAVIGVPVVAISHTAVASVVVPTAATVHTVRAF